MTLGIILEDFAQETIFFGKSLSSRSINNTVCRRKYFSWRKTQSWYINDKQFLTMSTFFRNDTSAGKKKKKNKFFKGPLQYFSRALLGKIQLAVDLTLITLLLFGQIQTVHVSLEWRRKPRGALPYMGCIGTCSPKGYGSSAVLVKNRVSILAILLPFW